jgi:hypothetical protein
VAVRNQHILSVVLQSKELLSIATEIKVLTDHRQSLARVSEKDHGYTSKVKEMDQLTAIRY